MKKVFLMAVLAGAIAVVSHGAEHGVAKYGLDDAHTAIGFSVRHMGIVNVNGRFDEFAGSVHYDGKNLSSLKVKAVIQAKSVDTNNSRRDDHLRNEDFFEVETYPEIHFKTLRVKESRRGAKLVGEITIKDTTKEIELDVKVSGPVDDPWGGKRIGIELSGELNRQDFGVGFDGASDRMIGDVVTLDIQIQAIQE